MARVTDAEHQVLVSDPSFYSSHAASCAPDHGELVVVFNQSVRRPHPHHPPSDPLFRNYLMRSADDGRTWSVPRVAPGYDWSGVECAGLTPLAGGGLLLHQWRFRWYPLEVGLDEGEDRAGDAARRSAGLPGNRHGCRPLGARARRRLCPSIGRWRA